MLSATTSSGPGMVETAHPLKDFTNTFVLSSTSKSLDEVPQGLAVDRYRERRSHQKSRTGCDNCKRRRVKCNEETPCERCSRKGERCQRPPRQRTPEVKDVSVSSQPPSSSSKLQDAIVNLLHMKLFHHFQESTRHTLMFVPEIWNCALQLCFEFDFLMNAILCVSARHLSTLHPENATYSAAAASHLSRALSLFRSQLSDRLISAHIDAFIATSILLQYDIWCSTDFVTPQDDGSISIDLAKDGIFTFASSLKEVFLKSISRDSAKTSIFMRQHIQIDPTDTLVQAAQISNETLNSCLDFFSYNRPVTLTQLSIPFSFIRGRESNTSNPWQQRLPKPDPHPIEDGYIPVIRRLCLILSFLPENHPPRAASIEAPFFPQLARYILSFPVMCHGPFITMVQSSDPHALLMLYHFYRAARVLLAPDTCWWAHGRASISERLLKEWLIRASTKDGKAAFRP